MQASRSENFGLLAALVLTGCATTNPPVVDRTPPTVRTVGDLLLTLCNEQEDAQSCAALASAYDRDGDSKKAQKLRDRACALGDAASCAHP